MKTEETKAKAKILRKLLSGMEFDDTNVRILLAGSRVRGDSTDYSDWDFVLGISDDVDPLTVPRGRWTHNGRTVSFYPQRQAELGTFYFASSPFRLSLYDIEADTLIEGPDDDAFLAARAAASAARVSQ